MTYQRRQPPNLLKQQLKLSSLIIPEYYAAHTAIWSGEYNEYLGDGGRGSLKSTFAATEVVLLVMRVPNIHAVVLRKVGNTIATSVWPEYNRVIDRMGIRHLWKQTKKPYTLTYVPTGQTIQFYGLDDPGKLKSIAVPFGYFGVMHFEEFDQYDGPEEIRNVEQSVFRGGPFSFSFKTFNSPAMARHWVNRYKREAKPKQFRHHTTYLTTPPEWLGPRFFDDAETLKQRDPDAATAMVPTAVQLNDCGWVANRWCELLPVPLELKQRLMELDNPLVRLELVADVLERTGIAPTQ